MLIIRADRLEVGDQIAEPGDGFLWNVTEIIKRTSKTTKVRLNSDYSSSREHWTDGPGIEQTFKSTSEVICVKK